MADASPPTSASGRSSVLYALGQLESTVAHQANTIAALPGSILALMTPHLAVVSDHETRIRALEVQRWMMAGGIVVIPVLVGWYLEIAK